MVKTFLILICVVFITLGITEFIFSLKSLYLMPKNNSPKAIVVSLKEDSLEEQIRYLTFVYRSFGSKHTNFVVLLTDQLSEESIEKCRRLVKGCGVILCKQDMLVSLLNSLNEI